MYINVHIYIYIYICLRVCMYVHMMEGWMVLGRSVFRHVARLAGSHAGRCVRWYAHRDP